MSIRKWQERVHELACEKGWWRGPDGQYPCDGLSTASLASKLALVHSEVSEALECLRNGEMERATTYGKPVGWPTELADIVIRVMDLAEATGVDLESEIQHKHEYNRTREYRHGGKRL